MLRTIFMGVIVSNARDDIDLRIKQIISKNE